MMLPYVRSGITRAASAGASAVVVVAALTACSIQVPTGSAPEASGQSRPSTSSAGAGPGNNSATASAVELPPQTVAQIRQQDMTFERGAYIKASDSLAFSDGLPESSTWKQQRSMTNGEAVYLSTAKCQASLQYTNPQDPLVVAGDDRASTQALFRFQDPSILDEYLVPNQWPWGESPQKAKASIEFLTYKQPATKTSQASSVSMRLFAATGTAMVFSVACPSDELLAAAVADLHTLVSVVPPDR